MTQRILAIAILFCFPIAAFLAPFMAIASRHHGERLWWLYALCAPLIAYTWWSTLRGDRELTRHQGYIDGLTRAIDLQREKKARA